MKRGEMPDYPEGNWPRSDTIKGEDEDGNNQRPYQWSSFGPGDYWGQDVDYWMPIQPLPTDKAPVNP